MNIENLILKHDEEITEIKLAASNMMLLWKIVGVVSLVVLGVLLKEGMK